MGNNIVIVIVFLFLFVSAPLNWQAAALEGEQDPVQQCNLNRMQSQDCLNQRDTVRIEDNRQARFRDRERIRSTYPQSDLLQELLTPRKLSFVSTQLTEHIKKVQPIRSESTEQESGLLEELEETPTP